MSNSTLKFLLICAIGLSFTPLIAQDKPLMTADPAPIKLGPQDNTSSELTAASVQGAWEAIEKNPKVEAAVKDQLRSMYEQALTALKEAAVDEATTQEFREAITSAPVETKAITSQLESMSSVEDAKAEATKMTLGLDSNQIQESVNAGQLSVDQLTVDLAKVTDNLALIQGRPAEINVRLPKAESELAQTVTKLASPQMAEDATSPARVADRLILQAVESQLRSELAMLDAEQRSQLARENLLLAQEKLLARNLANAKATLEVLKAAKNRTMMTEAQNIILDVEVILLDVPPDALPAQELAKEVQDLAKELEKIVRNLKLVSNGKDEITDRLDRLTDENQYVTAQLELGGSGDVIAELLFELRNRILRRGFNADITSPLPKLDDARIAGLRHGRNIRKQIELEKSFAERSAEDNPETAATGKLLKLRAKVLTNLDSQQKTMIDQLSALQRDNERYVTLAHSAMEFVKEQLFWIRSAPPVSVATLKKIPAGLAWIFQLNHGVEIWQAQTDAFWRDPIRYCGFLLLIGLLLTMRGRITAALKQTGIATRRISTDRYGLTLQALFWTVLLAVPLPLMFAFLWWTLSSSTGTSDWLKGVVDGSKISVWIAFLLGFVTAACRPAGLGVAHFGWIEAPLKKLRRSILGFELVYIPTLLLTCSTLFGTNASLCGENIGRFSFMLAQIWMALVLWRFLGSSDGVLVHLHQRHPDSLIARTRLVWFTLAVGFPVALVVLAWRGYFITAIELSIGLLSTLGIVAIGTFLNWMAVRWFAVKKRRLALAEAMEKRRARLAAAASREKAESDDMIMVAAEADLQLDLDLINDQTRHLLRMVSSMCVVIAIVFFWSETIPIFSALDKIVVPLSGLTLLSLAKAVLVVIATWIAVQNLPGLIELSVLRTTSIETGTRYAISRICQYVLTAIGLFFLFGILNIDWTKFGWIAAALSVGLGFGLQEVVANFVCGLILLFERPVRVGDVVTLDNINGTVTKIQMRATTITNWDRQEFIVPNKDLITGTILNWTLSTPINRVVIPVGVAYGTDTEKAREILLSAATDHPLVLKDPPPSTTFEHFADSSLTLILRAYLPDLDNRLKSISELHSEINQRFSAEGIEIAFPQLDLHVRDGIGADQVHGEFLTASHSES